MGYIDIGLVAPTLNDASAAAANFTKLQAALTAGGKVRFVGNGVAYINGHLTIGSNTELDVDKNLTIKLANQSNDNVLVNAAYSAAWTTLYDNAGTITTGPLSLIWSGSVVAWAQSTAVALGAYKSANGNLYWCASAGTTSGSGTGPSSTGSGIVDGTATWNYVTTYSSSVFGTDNMNAILHWPAHGLSAGAVAWITPQPDSGANNYWSGTQAAGTRGGLADSAYFGVFYAPAVNDTNYITVQLRRLPAVGFSGIPLNVKAGDHDIKIAGGGTVDANQANQTYPNGLSTMAVILAGVLKLEVDALNGINVGKYVLLLGGASKYTIKNVQGGLAGSLSDQIKVYGPAFDGIVTDCYGTGGDDVVSLHTQEGAGFFGYIIACGDILGVQVDRVSNLSGAGVTIFPNHQYLLMDSIKLSRIATHDTLTSNPQNPVKLASGVTPGGTIGTLHIADIETRDAGQIAVGTAGAGSFTVENLILDRVQSARNSSGQSLMSLFASATSTYVFKNVVARDCRQIFNATNDAAFKLGFAAGGSLTVNKLHIKGGYFNGSSSGFGAILTDQSGVTLGNAIIEGVQTDNLSWVVNGAFSGVYDVVDNRFNNTNTGITINTVNVTVRFSRNQFVNTSSGIIRYNTTSPGVVYSDGTNVLTGSSVWFIYPQAALTAAYGWDIQLDVTKATRAVGSYFYNTNAAPGSGTIAAVGPVMNDGTTAANSFHLMADPTKAY